MSNSFNVNDVVYLKESAESGYLESFKVSSVSMNTTGQWVYTFEMTVGPRITSTFGEKITRREHTTLYYNESELLSMCDALDLVETYLERRLAQIRALRSSRC